MWLSVGVLNGSRFSILEFFLGQKNCLYGSESLPSKMVEGMEFLKNFEPFRNITIHCFRMSYTDAPHVEFGRM